MTGLLRILLFACLWAMGPAAMAHGEETHGSAAVAPDIEAKSQSQSPTDAAPPSQRVRTDTDHEAQPASVLTSLHPATVHFPIALLLVAAWIELLAAARGSDKLANAATVMAWTGAAGAVVAAIFGWIHTGLWLGGGDTMQLHRWTGTALAFLAPVAAFLALRERRDAFRILIGLLALGVLLQGFWGAELAHGPNHLGL